MVTMRELLFDIRPKTGRARITIRLACTLHKKECRVRYTDTSDSVFTSELLRKGIGRILYPNDLYWFTPDLVLLDLALSQRTRVYEEHRADYVFVTTRKGCSEKTDAGIRVIYLPPSPYTPLSQGAREADFMEKLEEIRNNRKQTVIIGLLEGEETAPQDATQAYKAIKRCGLDSPRYSFIVLTDQGKIEEELFALPPNIAVYRPHDLHSLLPLCNLALTANDLNIQAECTFARIPVVEFSPRSLRTITPHRLERRLRDALANIDYLTDQQKQLCEYYEQENLRMDRLADELIAHIDQKRTKA